MKVSEYLNMRHINIGEGVTDDDFNVNVDIMDKIIESTQTLRTCTLSTTWAGSGPWTQTVAVSGITSKMKPLLVANMSDNISMADQKNYTKAFGFVQSGVITTNDGSITVKVYKKPTIAISIGLLGGVDI